MVTKEDFNKSILVTIKNNKMYTFKSLKTAVYSAYESNREAFMDMMNEIASGENFKRGVCITYKYKDLLFFNRFRRAGYGYGSRSAEVIYEMETGKFTLYLITKGKKEKAHNLATIYSADTVRSLKTMLRDFFH